MPGGGPREPTSNHPLAERTLTQLLQAHLATGPLVGDLAEGRLTTTVETAGRVLGVSRGVAYDAARNGELPGVLRIGHRFVVSIPVLLASLGIRPEESATLVEQGALAEGYCSRCCVKPTLDGRKP